MLDGSIPRYIEPRRLAERAAVLEGVISLESLPRLCEPLADRDGDVHVALQFERDAQRRLIMHCRLEGLVRMVCQRCLEPVAIALQADYTYLVVPPGKAPGDSRWDILEQGDEPLNVVELVEDELLLALPMVATHSTDVCQQLVGNTVAGANGDELSRSSPFSVLAQLKRDPHSRS